MGIAWITMTQRERRKVESQEAHKRSKAAKRVTGVKAKLYLKQPSWENTHEKDNQDAWKEKHQTKQNDEKTPQGVVPAHLLGREGQSWAKVLSNMMTQKRKEKAGKWEVSLPKVHAQGETEVWKVVRTGKRKRGRGWLPKSAFLEMALLENHPNVKDLAGRWASVSGRPM